MSIILSSAYLPSIDYFSLLLFGPPFHVDIHEHYVRQTYRSRAYILGANGVLPLLLPVKKGVSERVAMKDVRISYDMDWQKNHWKSLQSCYRSAPYFEFYEDELYPFFNKKVDFLIDFNTAMTQVLAGFFGFELHVSYTEAYYPNFSDEIIDLRNALDPKVARTFGAIPYGQVFKKDDPFVPNLSIVDLLFNQGRMGVALLKSTYDSLSYF